MSHFKHSTTLNGGIVTVVLSVNGPWMQPETSLSWIEYEGIEITEILDANALAALEMEAEHAFHSCGPSNDFPGPFPTL